jgi:hypothetical protein
MCAVRMISIPVLANKSSGSKYEMCSHKNKEGKHREGKEVTNEKPERDSVMLIALSNFCSSYCRMKPPPLPQRRRRSYFSAYSYKMCINVKNLFGKYESFLSCHL